MPGLPWTAGVASGLANTTGQVGGALGVSVLAAVAAAHTAILSASGVAEIDALTGGYHVAILVGAVAMAAAVVLAAIVLKKPAAGSAPVPATH